MNRLFMFKEHMTNRNSSAVESGSMEGTEFHLHKSQRSIFTGILHKIIDYTEHRLAKYIKTIKDAQQKSTLIDLIEKYKKGQVALSWRHGRPVWLPITKDN